MGSKVGVHISFFIQVCAVIASYYGHLVQGLMLVLLTWFTMSREEDMWGKEVAEKEEKRVREVKQNKTI